MKNSSSNFHPSQPLPLQSHNPMVPPSLSHAHSSPSSYYSSASSSTIAAAATSPSSSFSNTSHATHSKNRQPLHLIPILLGIMPYLMSTFFGHSQAWMEISFLLLILLWLYLSLKMPWEIYYCIMAKIDAYHRQRQQQQQHQHHPVFSTGSVSGDTTPTTEPLSNNSQPLSSSSSSFTTMAADHAYPYLSFLILLYYKALEIGAVILVFVSPFVSVYGIISFQNYYSEYQPIQFLSSFNIHLFLLAALIPSLKLFFGSPAPPSHPLAHRHHGHSLQIYDEGQRHAAQSQEKRLSMATSPSSSHQHSSMVSESAPIWAKTLANRMSRLETLMVQDGPKYAAIEGHHAVNSLKPAGNKLSSSLVEQADADADAVFRDVMSKRFANIEKNCNMYSCRSPTHSTNESFSPILLQKQALLAEQFNVLKYLWQCILRSLWHLLLITTWPCWLPVKMTLRLVRRLLHDLFSSRKDGPS